MNPMPVTKELINGIVRLEFFSKFTYLTSRIDVRNKHPEMVKKVDRFFQEVISHVRKHFAKQQYSELIRPYHCTDLRRYQALNDLNIRSENDSLIEFAKYLKCVMPLIPQSGVEEIRAFLMANLEAVLEVGTLNCDNLKMGRLPSEIALFKNLEEFKAANNGLNHLPAEFFLLKKLKRVSLKSNCFTNIDPRMMSLCKLEFLDYSKNEINELGEELFLSPSLKEIIVDENQIEAIPTSISFLKSLEIFSISENIITKLPKEMENLKMLKELYLNNNGIRTLPQWLGKLEELRKLEVSYNPINKLPDLSELMNLKVLDVENTLIEEILLSELPELEDLTIDYNGSTQIVEKGGANKKAKIEPQDAKVGGGGAGGGGSK
jgi:Leucine-rich repeat (LRR) protein